MRYLLDTGVLLRLLHRTDPLHAAVRNAVRQIHHRGHHPCMAPQNVAEFWNVCTRPTSARGGLGLSIEETARRLRLLEQEIDILPEQAGTYDIWKRLLIDHQVQGVQVHDARLVAQMQAAGVSRILTLNPEDFRRYAGLVVVTPDETAPSAPESLGP